MGSETEPIVDEIATLLARGFLKSRLKARPRQAGNEKSEVGLAFSAERSVHVSGACAAAQRKQDGSRRIEGN